MNGLKVVIDTSVFISFLLRRSTAQRRRFQTDPLISFYCPRFFLVELFKHKDASRRFQNWKPMNCWNVSTNFSPA